MDFFDILNNYMNVDTYYIKINKLKSKELENLYRFINIKWSRIVNNIEENEYSQKRLSSFSNFNNNIKQFIDNHIVLALFIKNIIDRY